MIVKRDREHFDEIFYKKIYAKSPRLGTSLNVVGAGNVVPKTINTKIDTCIGGLW